MGGNTNNTEVYKVTHSMLSSIPFPRVLTHDWFPSEQCNKATFSESLLTTKRDMESPGQIALWNHVLKSSREVRGCLWPANEKSKLPMHYNQRKLLKYLDNTTEKCTNNSKTSKNIHFFSFGILLEKLGPICL